MAPCFAGPILFSDRVEEGYVVVEDGRVAALGTGEPEEAPDATGWITPRLVNAHTHMGDAFLRDRPGKPRNVADLVGPGGWKHRHLASASPDEMRTGMHRFVTTMHDAGVGMFLDFREGGVDGVRAARRAVGNVDVTAVLMGRPRGNDFDEEEAHALLEEADGVALSGMRDLPGRVLEAWAEACHDAHKPFAVHVSEDHRDDLDAVLALEPAFVVHMTQGTPRDFDDLAAARVPVVVCPRSNAWFGLRPPLAALREAGVTVALGTDNAMLHDGDVRNEMAAARRFDPLLDTETLLRMAIHHGHACLGRRPDLPRRGDPADLLVLPDPVPGTRREKPGFAPGAP